jgi:hypothetical protein
LDLIGSTYYIFENTGENRAKGSRKNNFTFLARRFGLGLADLEEQKAQ